jgi:hypothetical protein
MQAAELTLDRRTVVASIKSRPPSGIMFAVFRAVKQFLSLLTLFSSEFYSLPKTPKNKANMLDSKAFGPVASHPVRAKKSRLLDSFPGSGFWVQRDDDSGAQ